MHRNTASSVDQAIEWLMRWKAESRTILFTYVSTTMEVAFVQFKGSVKELKPLESGSIAVQIAGAEGFAGVHLTGSKVDPSLATVPASARQVVVEFRNSPPFVIAEAIELVLASGSLLFLWRRDSQARKPSNVH
jgi:hypothetical protein